MTAELTGEQLRDKVTAWWPATLTPTAPVPPAVNFAREVVAAAAPRRWVEARTVLNYVYAYAQFLAADGVALDRTTVFAKEAVERYEALGLGGKSNSTNAMTSYLRRMAPGIGFAGTLRPTGLRGAKLQATPLPQMPTQVAPGIVVGLPDDTSALPANVEAVLTDFVPAALRAELWDQVRVFARGAARRVSPQLPAFARDLVRASAYLAAWVLTQHLPLRVDVVFAGPTIERFLTEMKKGKVPTTSVATYASWLHGLRAAHGISLEGGRKAWGRKAAQVPYSPAEQQALRAYCNRIQRDARRRWAHAAVTYVLDLGAFGVEAGWAEPGDIIEVAPGVVEVTLKRPAADVYDDSDAALALDLADLETVGLRSRVVRAAGDAAHRLLQVRAAAEAAGDTWLLAGSPNPSTRRCRANAVLKPAKGGFDVPLDLGRGRATWFVEAAAAGLYPTVVELCDAAGIVGLDVIDHVMDYIRLRRAELVAEGAATIQELP